MVFLIAGGEVGETKWEWPRDNAEGAVMQEESSVSRDWRGKEQTGGGACGQG